MDTKIKLEFDLSERLCEDELIGTLIFEDNTYKFDIHKNYNSKIIRNREEYESEYKGDYIKYKNLAIILESPHIDEFNVINENKKSVWGRPANGKTGKKFREEFENIINSQYSSKLNECNYFIYLVNSIQYQCSLGVTTKEFRDYVWLTLWQNEEIREDFINRLKIINPSVILNCCTNGSHKREIKNDIISLNHSKTSKKISLKYLETIKYNVSNNVISDNNNLEVLKYDKAEEVKLKGFVKYQIEENLKFKGFYDELSHPIRW
ncbi:hypothetical protein [Clostridium septicum]|uniref:hypothetical protein n=1 Tax=Clostridium septicum TaxID=1504 RepID=UPI000FF8EEEA|nr:hypothetical protein [Clostridium septicum]QAS59587.1 hypothetical protein EI377_01495 [Clostridium septicum]